MTTVKLFKLVLLLLVCTLAGLIVMLLRDEDEFVYFSMSDTMSCPLEIELDQTMTNDS